MIYIIKPSKAHRNNAFSDIERSRKEENHMQAKLVGIQHINFTNNGETINGTNIFCAFKGENVEGLRTEKFFLRPEIKLPDCKLNDNIEISFNMKGKVIYRNSNGTMAGEKGSYMRQNEYTSNR